MARISALSAYHVSSIERLVLIILYLLQSSELQMSWSRCNKKGIHGKVISPIAGDQNEGIARRTAYNCAYLHAYRTLSGAKTTRASTKKLGTPSLQS